MQIDFKISGNLQRQLEKAARKAGDLTYISKKMGDFMVKSTTRTFEKQGARGNAIFGSGEKWTGLTDVTKKWRKKVGHPWDAKSKILQVTGNLKGSITREPHRDKVVWGTSSDAPYGKYLHKKRPFLKFLREDHTELVKVTREYVERLFK
jgi:phage gpG-like protein